MKKIVLIVLIILAQPGQATDNSLAKLEEYRSTHQLPGKVVTGLPMIEDREFLSHLQKYLLTYNFTTPYQANVFDCSDMSIITRNKLAQAGYHAFIMYDIVTPTMGHCWVVVESQEKYVPIRACNCTQGMGDVVLLEKGLSGWMFNNSAEYHQSIE